MVSDQPRATQLAQGYHPPAVGFQCHMSGCPSTHRGALVSR
jgi:hypothetical protein